MAPVKVLLPLALLSVPVSVIGSATEMLFLATNVAPAETTVLLPGEPSAVSFNKVTVPAPMVVVPR